MLHIGCCLEFMVKSGRVRYSRQICHSRKQVTSIEGAFLMTSCSLWATWYSFPIYYNGARSSGAFSLLGNLGSIFNVKRGTSIHWAWLRWIIWSHGCRGPAKRVPAEEETHNWIHAWQKRVRLLGRSTTAAEGAIEVWRPSILKWGTLLEGIREESVCWHRVRLGSNQGRRLVVASRTSSVHVTLLKDQIPRDYFLRGRERESTALVCVTVFWGEIKLLRVVGLRGATLMRVALHVLWSRKFKVALLHRYSFYRPILY